MRTTTIIQRWLLETTTIWRSSVVGGMLGEGICCVVWRTSVDGGGDSRVEHEWDIWEWMMATYGLG